MPPDGKSALFRAQNPKTWWWTAEIDFMAAILHVGQMANWQRSGGTGPKPKPIKRPAETRQRRRSGLDPTSATDLAERRKRMKERRAVG